ncbi:MAG: hypothetical protein KDA81_12580 [Planctomycetaceae bacterium]|nr:hypothetical protein [Planctomycetaceae bacterium]
MSKKKQQKQKDREKRVAQKKLAETARRREATKDLGAAPTSTPRAKKVLTAGVKNMPQTPTQRPTVTNRRTGG